MVLGLDFVACPLESASHASRSNVHWYFPAMLDLCLYLPVFLSGESVVHADQMKINNWKH